MGLYIEDFLPMLNGSVGKPPSVVRIWHEEQRNLVIGITESDVTVSLQNQFGPLLPDVTTLQDIQYLFNSANITSYAMTTNQVWRGTSPIAFSLDFFVINWKPGLNYKENLSNLAKLCTIIPNVNANVFEGIKVHGGYHPNFFTSNEVLDTGGTSNEEVQKGDGNNETILDNLKTAKEVVSNLFGNALEADLKGDRFPGTLTVGIGSSFVLNNLLLLKIDITPSIVEVCDNASGSGAQPLYYRVGATFQTCRAAMQSDTDKILGVKKL